MDRLAAHRIVSAVIYYVAFFVLLGFVATVTIFATEPVSGGWQVVVGILAFLISTGLALRAFGKLRRWRADGYYRLTFPAYEGVRYPAFHLVSSEAGGQIEHARPPLNTFAIAEAGDAIFLLSAMRSDQPEEINSGSVAKHPLTREGWAIARDDLLAIDVYEMTDEAIKAAAVDTRDYGDRLVEEGVNRLFGVSTKRKIVPFAAFVVVTARPSTDDAWPERWTFAIPTEIHDSTMHFMGLGPKANDTELIDAAIAHGVKQVKGELVTEAHHRVEDLVGEAPVEVIDDIIDLKQDIDFWVNLGAAKIATTNGARGRAMARIISERVRRWAGLDRVTITTMGAID